MMTVMAAQQVTAKLGEMQLNNFFMAGVFNL